MSRLPSFPKKRTYIISAAKKALIFDKRLYAYTHTFDCMAINCRKLKKLTDRLFKFQYTYTHITCHNCSIQLKEAEKCKKKQW